jgi:hypothetical protein
MTDIIAILPAPVLWAAAQFALKPGTVRLYDDPKPIQSIHVRRTSKTEAFIESTDGHRAFRCRITLVSAYNQYSAENHLCVYLDDKLDSLLLDAEAFRSKGKLGQSVSAVITEKTVDVVKEGKGTVESRVIKQGEGTFPNIPELWPDPTTGLRAGEAAFNPKYIAEFCKVAQDLTSGGAVRFSFGAGKTNPATLTAETEHYKLEYLVMPTLLRD